MNIIKKRGRLTDMANKRKIFVVVLLTISLFALIFVQERQFNPNTYGFVDYDISPSTDTGFASPSLATNIRLSGRSWAQVDNTKLQSDTYARNSLTSNFYSDYLRVSDFDFSIPIATIDGIEVEIDKYAENSLIEDYAVYLVLEGVIKSNNYAKTGVGWATSDNDDYVSYGGASDTWGSGLTYTDINDANFGVEISAKNTDPFFSFYQTFIDHIRIKIYYTIIEDDNDPPTWDTLTESADPLELGTNQTISIDVYDESTISNVYIEINGVNYTMSNVSNTYSYFNWLPLLEGIFYYQIYMIDEHNNIAKVSRSFLVRNTPDLILTMLILISLMVLMLFLHLKVRRFELILVLFLFSLVIGIYSLTKSMLPFFPYFQIFFMLFQTVLFVIKVIQYKQIKRGY